MNPDETATVLAKCAAVDRRTVGRADVLAWHEIIGDIELPVALEAVKRWYSNNRDWIMPSDVRELAHVINREERRREGERRAAEAIEAEQADPTRRDRSEAIEALIDELRAKLPPGNPDSLRYASGYWRQQREARERQERALPNPHYDPGALARLADADPPAASTSDGSRS